MSFEVLTVAEVAEYLSVHPATIYKLLKARRLPAFKVGSDWRFNREHIDEWRAAQEKRETG
jgi:excisionase family DNA binding protein